MIVQYYGTALLYHGITIELYNYGGDQITTFLSYYHGMFFVRATH